MVLETFSRNVAFFVFQEHTAFIPLKFVYPECLFLIEKHPQVYPLSCFGSIDCPANQSCAEVLAKRVHYLYTEVLPPGVKQLLAYYKYRDKPNSIRVGVFDKDLDAPRIMTVNPWAFKKFQKESLTFQWTATDEYLLMSGGSGIIPVTSLVR